MGYYVETKSVDFRIPATQIPNVFAALRELNSEKYNHLKRGGSHSGGKQTAWWYSWMGTDWHLTCKSVKDIFELLGFEECHEDGLGFVLGTYNQKHGQEDLFLSVAAKWAQPGKIVWQGEDGSRWENRFELGKMTTVDLAPLVWSDELEDFEPPFLQNV